LARRRSKIGARKNPVRGAETKPAARRIRQIVRNPNRQIRRDLEGRGSGRARPRNVSGADRKITRRRSASAGRIAIRGTRRASRGERGSDPRITRQHESDRRRRTFLAPLASKLWRRALSSISRLPNHPRESERNRSARRASVHAAGRLGGKNRHRGYFSPLGVRAANCGERDSRRSARGKRA
jgi:hypothetical protein